MLKACAKKASKNQNSQFYHQWIKLIVECQGMKYYYQDIISLLKAMQQDMTIDNAGEKIYFKISNSRGFKCSKSKSFKRSTTPRCRSSC